MPILNFAINLVLLESPSSSDSNAYLMTLFRQCGMATEGSQHGSNVCITAAGGANSNANSNTILIGSQDSKS
jgi:hypothetical protein